jgi:hypothetical protein
MPSDSKSRTIASLFQTLALGEDRDYGTAMKYSARVISSSGSARMSLCPSACTWTPNAI